MAKRLTGNENGPNYLGVSEVQAVASTFAQIIFGIVDMLALCHSGLGMTPDAASMSEENALREQLRGDIEILVNETLPAATKILGEMAFETEDSLLDRWRQVLERRRLKTLNSGGGAET